MVLLAEPFPLAANAVRVPTWGVDHWIRECWIPMVGMNPCTGTTQSDRRIKFNNGYLIIKLEFWIMGWWRFNNNTSTDFEDKPWKEKANLNSWKRWNLEVASFFIWRLFGPLECVCTFIVLLDPIRTRAFVANSGTIWPVTFDQALVDDQHFWMTRNSQLTGKVQISLWHLQTLSSHLSGSLLRF